MALGSRPRQLRLLHISKDAFSKWHLLRVLAPLLLTIFENTQRSILVELASKYENMLRVDEHTTWSGSRDYSQVVPPFELHSSFADPKHSLGFRLKVRYISCRLPKPNLKETPNERRRLKFECQTSG